MPPSVVALAGTAAFGQHGVEIIEARRCRHRRHEVGAGVFDQPFDLALVVALARTAEAIGEQVVADQFGERPCPLAPAVAADLGHRDLEVVVKDRQRHATEERKRCDMAVKEGLGRLARIRLHEAGVRLRQIRQKKWIFWRTPPITPTASPKSTCPCPGGCANGTNVSRPRARPIRT